MLDATAVGPVVHERADDGAGDGAQAMLVEAQPKLFFVPPYVGSKGWIGIYLDGREPKWPMLRDLIVQSYRLIAPKRFAEALEG